MLKTGSLSTESVDSACKGGGAEEGGGASEHFPNVTAHTSSACKTGSNATDLQVDDGVRAAALHGVELQVALEVAGVEARDGQPVAEPCLQRAHTSTSTSISISLLPLARILDLSFCEVLTSGALCLSAKDGLGAVEYK